MTEIFNLQDEKDKKKYKKVISDIDNILKVLSLSQQSLSFFKHYILCQEIISVMETNKTLFELYKKKYQNKLVENGKTKLQET